MLITPRHKIPDLDIVHTSDTAITSVATDTKAIRFARDDVNQTVLLRNRVRIICDDPSNVAHKSARPSEIAISIHPAK
jgi:hypothetical protein